MEKYELLQTLGQGNFGVAKLARLKNRPDMYVAIKFLERGENVDKHVERELLNLRLLSGRHPNVIGFHEVFVTKEHLCIVMEYASGGELFNKVVKQGRFTEDQARYFFQQLIRGLAFIHRSGVCHRDLKLENTLLTENAAPVLKICDFGYSKSQVIESLAKTTVGTPAYIAPEVLSHSSKRGQSQYDGHGADVWSCGVLLYVMLVGRYPFEDQQDPKNFQKTIARILRVKYHFPTDVRLSQDCLDLLSRIFIKEPERRITLNQIQKHKWFLRNLPCEDDQTIAPASEQSVEEIQKVVSQARIKPLPNGAPNIPGQMAKMGNGMGGMYAIPMP